ncbi:MAG TPA: hypothetical protein DCE81_07555 [Cytophagales bacterium]|nr:hypothetical protein [Cytophagales bacterium]
MLITRFLFCFVLVFCEQPLAAQQTRAQAAAFNVATGSLVSGLGALINKKPGERPLRVFLAGMARGAAGGALVYASKEMVYQFGQTNRGGWAWGSKLTNAAGMSIIENAASNARPFTTWHFNFGFNRLELRTDQSVKLRYKIMPFALWGFVYSATQYSFSFSETMRIGQPFFLTDKIDQWGPDFQPVGIAIANSITLIKPFATSQTVAHEIIHAYQYEGFGVFNTYLNKPRTSLVSGKGKWLAGYTRWVYTDFNFLLYTGVYNAFGTDHACYFDNPFEQEANFYSDKLTCGF